ncbi:MAG: FHA domain-containing protein [Thermanaerothrix sp.]|nr:FHA domain-containing protein [Thermanaerothrix sp.]
MIFPYLYRLRWLFSLSLVVVTSLLLINVVPSANAQAAERILVRQIDSTTFPTVSLYVEPYDTAGQFIQNLNTEDLTILENGQPRSPLSLTFLNPGAHLILVFNYGPEWSVAYAQRSRFQYLRQHWLTWAQAQPSPTSDRLSLITNSGLQLVRNNDPTRWADWLETARPDLQREVASLNGLTRALALAAPSDPENAQRPVIFFLTAPLPASVLPALADLGQRAQTLGVPIHVWMIAHARASTRLPQNYTALNDMAVQSGGQFILFSGPESLPDPEPILRPLRFRYRVTYTSSLTTSGKQELRVRLTHEGVTLESEPISFDLTVLPPNPILLAPPAQITRTWESPKGQREPHLVPSTYAFSFITEFPDQHPRSLRAARLYVNDTLVTERLEPPFEVLEWPLDEITLSGRYRVRVEVEDSLGLKGQSQDWPLEIIVAEPPRSPLEQTWQRLSSPEVIPFWAVILSAATLGLFLWRWRAYRRLTQPLYARWTAKQRAKTTPPSASPPTTVLFPLATTPTAASAWLVWLSSNEVPFAFIRDETAEPPTEKRFYPLSQAEVTLGSDRQRATIWIPHPSVEGVHAHLTLGPEGYKLTDAGTIAGTWLNGAALPPEGACLSHGDILHLGSVALRFESMHPTPKPHPTLRPYEEML